MAIIKLTPLFIQELGKALPLLLVENGRPAIRPQHLRNADQTQREYAAQLVREGRADALVWPEDQSP